MDKDDMNQVDESSDRLEFWQLSRLQIGFLVIILLLLIWSFGSGLERMVLRWGTSEEYGYGYMIPFISAFFIWGYLP